MFSYIHTALKEQVRGVSLPFALVEKSSNRAIGSARYGNIAPIVVWRLAGHGVAPAWQRTAANTEAKYLLLRHAFETLGCIRVELKTDSLNERSRAAILRIGARKEGTFRHHRITASDRIRHTVYFRILDSESPDVKARVHR
jgi:RimJ/RimL family protein N-acetyltransferase